MGLTSGIICFYNQTFFIRRCVYAPIKIGNLTCQLTLLHIKMEQRSTAYLSQEEQIIEIIV